MTIDDARLGAQQGEHRARAWPWSLVMVVCFAACGALWYWLVTDGAYSGKQIIAALVWPLIVLRAAVFWLELLRLRVRVHEHGLVVRDLTGTRTAAWSEVRAVEERIDGQKLAALVLTVPSGTVKLPRDLRGFDEVRATIDRHVRVPRSRATAGIFR